MNNVFTNKSVKPKMALVAGVASILTVTLLIVIKAVAYLESDSTSVLASLIDSVADASVSLMTFMAIRVSLRPADHKHRFGHGKVEGLAALFQSAFIAGAGVFLIFESMSRFSGQHVVQDHVIAISVMAVSAIMSLLLVTIQKYTLSHAPSLAVEADRTHYSMDIVVNIAVIGIITLLYYGAPPWIDPVFAILVSGYLGLTAKHIAGQGVGMLVDRELLGDAREIMTKKILSHKKVKGMHDLRTRQSGMRVFISFDIELDPDLTLHKAHEIVREVEHSLLEDFPHADILIHADPYGDTADSRHQISGVHHS